MATFLPSPLFLPVSHRPGRRKSHRPKSMNSTTQFLSRTHLLLSSCSSSHVLKIPPTTRKPTHSHSPVSICRSSTQHHSRFVGTRRVVDWCAKEEGTHGKRSRSMILAKWRRFSTFGLATGQQPGSQFLTLTERASSTRHVASACSRRRSKLTQPNTFLKRVSTLITISFFFFLCPPSTDECIFSWTQKQMDLVYIRSRISAKLFAISLAGYLTLWWRWWVNRAFSFGWIASGFVVIF